MEGGPGTSDENLGGHVMGVFAGVWGEGGGGNATPLLGFVSVGLFLFVRLLAVLLCFVSVEHVCLFMFAICY